MTEPEARIRVLWNGNAGSKGGLPTNRTGEEELRALTARYLPGAEFVATGSEDEAIAAADSAREAGYAAVIAAGGDGSVGLVATRLLGSPTALGILPLGSVMNVARMLGIPRKLEQAFEIITAGHTRRIDVGSVNDEPFFETASVGMNAAIFSEVQRADEGDYGGILRAIGVAFRYRPARMRLTLDDGEISTRALVVTISNGPYTGIGFTVAPHARLDDGRFDVTLFRYYSKLDLIRHFMSIRAGRRSYSPHTTTYRSKHVRIGAARPLPARADGRELGTTPIEMSIKPGVLTVLAPADQAHQD
ncbi:MAG: diacylglycerol kinase family protein [Candidatus Limnocylindrales bacterium]